MLTASQSIHWNLKVSFEKNCDLEFVFEKLQMKV